MVILAIIYQNYSCMDQLVSNIGLIFKVKFCHAYGRASYKYHRHIHAKVKYMNLLAKRGKYTVTTSSLLSVLPTKYHRRVPRILNKLTKAQVQWFHWQSLRDSICSVKAHYVRIITNFGDCKALSLSFAGGKSCT